MSEGRKDKAKKSTGNREKWYDEITTPLTKGINPKPDTLHARRHAVM